jgi:CheY-like chemotaxis protein
MLTHATQSPIEALSWLKAGQSFDLLIVDMQLPDIDGVMLAREIRKLKGMDKIPLVLITSLGWKPESPEFKEVGFSGWLTKPIKKGKLLEALVQAVSGRREVAIKTEEHQQSHDKLAERLPLRILLCDDNAINQKVATRLLQQMGYQPDVVATGNEAVAVLEQRSYDLVLMDVMMPGLNGYETTRLIRERQHQPQIYPNYKASMAIVAMTASAMEGDKEKCLEAGMDDYVAKPVRADHFRAIVERWGKMAFEGGLPHDANRTANCMDSKKQESLLANLDSVPVDMERLNEVADGDSNNLRELIDLYLQETSRQLGQLQIAVSGGKSEEIRRLAHCCAGASASCGMRRITPLLKHLEQIASKGDIETAGSLTQQILIEFKNIGDFVAKMLPK